MIPLTSSWRSVKLAETLARARAIAPSLGITRVTEITRLDALGIPVFASVRPTAADGSLCVNAGKGITRLEAQVGAYMEAIEYAVAEPDGSHIEIELATARDLLDGARGSEVMLDLCPVVGRPLDSNAPLACVVGQELISGNHAVLPAELVFFPYVHRPGTGVFGSQSNGLASGNTVSEATLHALLEVVERDVRSFNYVRDNSRRILHDSLPAAASTQVSAILEMGLDVCVRVLPNALGIPVFEAEIWDSSARSPSYLSGGFGCHLDRDIALIRAISEAVQSRLSWIHGGRDDLEEAVVRNSSVPPALLAASATRAFEKLRNWPHVVNYEDVVYLPRALSLDDAVAIVIERLQTQGFHEVCRVTLTRPEDSLHVVRIVVPRMEFFRPRASHRVGPRLRDFIRGVATA